MIRLMLSSYSKLERETLAVALENAQHRLEEAAECRTNPGVNCHDCNMRHLCTDLLAASVFAKDFKEPTK